MGVNDGFGNGNSPFDGGGRLPYGGSKNVKPNSSGASWHPQYQSRFGGEGFVRKTRRPTPLAEPAIPKYKREGGLLGKLLGPQKTISGTAPQQMKQPEWENQWRKVQADDLAQSEQPAPAQQERFPAMDDHSYPTQAPQTYPPQQQSAVLTANGTVVTGARICNNCGSLTSGTYCEFCGSIL